MMLSFSIIAGELVIVAGYIGLMTLGMLPPDVREITNGIVALLVGHIGTYVNYQWGSSAGSQAKDATIAQAVSNTNGRHPTP